jgi:hypothetical protein
MSVLKNFWNWLNGKKRTVALIYWSVVVPAMAVIWPVSPPGSVSKTVTIIGLVLSTIGLGHAAIKTRASGKQSSEDVEQEEASEKQEQQPIVEEQGKNNVAEDKKDS